MSSSLAYKAHNALNAICPYFTMFPLEYPLRLLNPHRKHQPIIMDPFCGRGTTLFAARQLGMAAQGIDSSPIAVAISRAKLCRVDIDAVLNLAQSYIDSCRGAEIPTSEFFQYAFAPSVLEQICAIRSSLLKVKRDNDVTVLLRAAMLGCLHGPLSKNLESQSYFSNQMPRTFATKPAYSVRFWKERELIAPRTTVIAVLKRKLSRLANSDLPRNGSITDVRLGDSQFAKSLPVSKRNFSVVITSPPYYGMTTYVEDQWLRSWFLGGTDYVQYGVTEQLEHAGRSTFAESLGRVWRNMARTDADELHMYIRFGTIPSAKTDPKALIRDSLESSGVSWRVVSTRQAATATSGRRQAKQMSVRSMADMEYDFHIYRV